MISKSHAHLRPWYRKFAVVVDALADRGWFVAQDFWPQPELSHLEQTVAAGSDRLQPAALGRERIHDPHTRNDHIRWLQAEHAAEQDYLRAMELYRKLLNRRLFLNLQDYECHYASYAPGGFYRRHLDGFRDRRSRIVTTVSFLNSHWQATDGGELVIYDPAAPQRELTRVLPRAGTFVSFLSEDFPHEVLPGQRQRRSLTGWFRLPESRLFI